VSSTVEAKKMPHLLDKSSRRTLDSNLNNRHTGGNTIHMVQSGHRQPDGFMQVKNFTNFNNAHHPYGTTRISNDDDERSLQGDEDKQMIDDQCQRENSQNLEDIESAIDSIIVSEALDILEETPNNIIKKNMHHH